MRSISVLLTSALLSGAALMPAAGAAPSAPAPTTTSDLPVPDADEREVVRDRVTRTLNDAGAIPDFSVEAFDTQGITMNPLVERYAGPDRYATAANLSTVWSDYVWVDEPEPFPFDKVVLLASGENFPDALSGGALAGYFYGPVLLTRKDSIPSSTQEALTELQPDYIAVLGGPAAISEGVETQLASYVPHSDFVVRLAGVDRYATSAAIASVRPPAETAYIATGENWPDGLAGGAAAAWDFGPMLLTRSDDVPAVVMDVLTHVTQPSRIIVLGGPASINESVISELETVAPVTRIAGSDRYATAADLAVWLETMSFAATMASGLNWPDALAGSAFAALTGSPMLLVRTESLPAVTRQAVLDTFAVWITVLGGPASVSEAVLDELRALEIVVPMPPP